MRGKTDGAPLKTILEYAEQRGLATGFVTNDSLTGATPASLYAHANDRAQSAAIFQQAFAPRFGDGVDVMIGPGRAAITKSLAAAGVDIADPVGDSRAVPSTRRWPRCLPMRVAPSSCWTRRPSTSRRPCSPRTASSRATRRATS